MDGQVPAAGIGMMDQPPTGCCRVWAPCPECPECLLQGLEGRVGSQTVRYPPADHEPGEGVDREHRIREARPGRSVGDVGQPETVRAVGTVESQRELVRALWDAETLAVRAWLPNGDEVTALFRLGEFMHTPASRVPDGGLESCTVTGSALWDTEH